MCQNTLTASKSTVGALCPRHAFNSCRSLSASGITPTDSPFSHLQALYVSKAGTDSTQYTRAFSKAKESKNSCNDCPKDVWMWRGLISVADPLGTSWIRELPFWACVTESCLPKSVLTFADAETRAAWKPFHSLSTDLWSSVKAFLRQTSSHSVSNLSFLPRILAPSICWPSG